VAEAINIIVTGGPNIRFIEIENDAGESMRVGEYIHYKDRIFHNLWRTRITPEDVRNAGRNAGREEAKNG